MVSPRTNHNFDQTKKKEPTRTPQVTKSDSFEVPKLTQPSQDSFTNPGPDLVVGSTNHPVRTGYFIPYIPCSFLFLNSGSSACIHLIILSQENCINPGPSKQQKNKASNGNQWRKPAKPGREAPRGWPQEPPSKWCTLPGNQTHTYNQSREFSKSPTTKTRF